MALLAIHALPLAVNLPFLFAHLLPSLFVVVVYVAILTHPSSIELLMTAPPRLLYPSIAMVTVGTHFLGIVRSVFMSTGIEFLSIIK